MKKFILVNLLCFNQVLDAQSYYGDPIETDDSFVDSIKNIFVLIIVVWIIGAIVSSISDAKRKKEKEKKAIDYEIKELTKSLYPSFGMSSIFLKYQGQALEELRKIKIEQDKRRDENIKWNKAREQKAKEDRIREDKVKKDKIKEDLRVKEEIYRKARKGLKTYHINGIEYASVEGTILKIEKDKKGSDLILFTAKLSFPKRILIVGKGKLPKSLEKIKKGNKYAFSTEMSNIINKDYNNWCVSRGQEDDISDELLQAIRDL